MFIMRCRWPSSIIRIATRRKSSTLAPVILRPYQEHCVDACISALDSGSTRIGVSLPTGSGKTTVFISLLARLAPPAFNLEATKSIIIVNNIELARQSAIQVARLFPGWSVEIEQGAKYIASGLADVYVYSYSALAWILINPFFYRTVATYQTLNNEGRLAKFNPRTLKAVIVDEAHHSAAPSQVPLFFFAMGNNSSELTFYLVIVACSPGLILKFSPRTRMLSKDQNLYPKFLS